MKALGFTAIAATAISFILWLISWGYWRYQDLTTYDSSRYESQKVIRNIILGVGTVSTLTEYLAILLIAIGLILAANRLPKSFS
ncbi:MAG: hypothetical protein ABJA66_12535 [Actinomycetota bacterium]